MQAPFASCHYSLEGSEEKGKKKKPAQRMVMTMAHSMKRVGEIQRGKNESVSPVLDARFNPPLSFEVCF
jgi:hypothetical protein